MYTDNTTKDISLEDKEITIEGFNSEKIESRMITVKYKEFTTTYKIEITDGIDYNLKSLTINDKEIKLTSNKKN